MMRRILGVWLIPGMALAAQVVTIDAPDGSLNIRKTPSPDAPVIATLPTGSTVTAIDVTVDWTMVKLADESVGYARTKYLTSGTAARGASPQFVNSIGSGRLDTSLGSESGTPSAAGEEPKASGTAAEGSKASPAETANEAEAPKFLTLDEALEVKQPTDPVTVRLAIDDINGNPKDTTLSGIDVTLFFFGPGREHGRLILAIPHGSEVYANVMKDPKVPAFYEQMDVHGQLVPTPDGTVILVREMDNVPY